MDVYSRLGMPGTLERETKNAPISGWLCQASAISNSHSIMHIQKDPYKYMYFDNQYQFYTSILHSTNSHSIMHIQKDSYKNTLTINISSIRVYQYK